MATGIIYGAKSGIVRRIVTQTDAASLAAYHVGPSEALLLWSASDTATPPSPAAATAAVAQTTGLTIPSARCVVVDTTTGLVVGACMADPALDAHPAGHVVHDDAAALGWCLLTNGSFVDPSAPVLSAPDPVTGVVTQVGVAGIPPGAKVAGSFMPPTGTPTPAGGSGGYAPIAVSAGPASVVAT